MNVCACIGPAGDCPCIRRERGLPVKITESYISPDVWDSMPDEDKKKINELKMNAAMSFIFSQRNEKKNANT